MNPSDPKPAPKRGITRQRRGQMAGAGERAEPRLPHERDESSDSQEQDGVRNVIRQGHDDVVRGLQDTDKGPPLGEAYEKQKKQGTKAPAAGRRRAR